MTNTGNLTSQTGPPKIGEIRGSKSLGKKRRGRYIYVCCPQCNEFRWIRLDTYKRNKRLLCFACTRIKVTQGNVGSKRSQETRKILGLLKRGAKNPRWLGGKKCPGPKSVAVPGEHPYSCMANQNGHVLEHRLIMAGKLGRPLDQEEVVHHKNRDRRDNRIENLLLLSSQSEHVSLHSVEDYSHEMP